MHSIFDALVTAAAADVAGHRFNYLIVGRFWILCQQRGRLHDLADLAIAALRDVELSPSLLNRMIASRVKAFDGGDLAADHVGHGGDAGARSLLVDHDGTRTAQRHAAAILGPGQAHLITEKPKQRKIWVAIPVLFLAINLQLDHDRFSLFLSY